MTIYDMHNAMGLKKLHQTKWEGIYGTGDFEGLGDYNAGILKVGIGITASKKDQYTVMFHINTIDDGAWDACDMKDDYTFDSALIRLDEIANSFITYMSRSTKLPSEKEINNFLMPLKLWGEFTG